MAKKSKKKKILSALQEVRHPNAAGIDVSASEHVVAIPELLSDNPVRSFGSFHQDIQALTAWLLESNIVTVAMESTGNYWVNLYDALCDAGIEVYVVNARHVKGVPGRKTDVKDAQWLQQLHTAGLLNPSFVPEPEVRRLRYLERHRAELIQEGSRAIQHMQKVYNEMNIQLHHVLRDITGVSGCCITEAIIAGKRDPEYLASLRVKSCKTPLGDVRKALDGHYNEEYILVLKQSYERWQHSQKQVQEIGRVLQQAMAEYKKEELPPLEESKQLELPGITVPRQAKNAHSFNIQEEGVRLLGTDLTLIPSISVGTISVLITEIGGAAAFKENFKNGRHFASWLGLCPDNRISGGKNLPNSKAKTRKVKNRIAYQLRMGAMTLWRSDSALGDFCRRMKGSLGKAEGITATAHKIARIIYALVTQGKSYSEEKAAEVKESTKAKQVINLKKRAAKLGLTVVETAAA